jgi:putative sugar O-methyltransferase
VAHQTGVRERRPFAEPSLFWQKLAHKHGDDLERDGPHVTKRQQALAYFTWRWRWSEIRKSRQFRFLLSRSAPWTVLRCVFTPTRLSGAAWHAVPWTRRERWLYIFAVRLLWQYARRHDELRVLSLPEPRLGDPLPVRWNGRLISQDLANSALEANAMARALDGSDPRSIVEVGAGYGRTAYALLTLFPQATYTIVDIEPALTISRWYLTSLFPSERLRFLAPEEARQLREGSADLVVSVSSLHEMRPDQLEGYLELFDSIAAGGVVYLKQWERWTNPVDGVTLAFDEYPVPAGWRPTFDEPAPVQTNFRHAAWCVPSA